MSDRSTLRALVPSEESTTDVLGVWQLVPGGDQQEEAGIVWEVNMAPSARAESVLRAPAERVATAARAIPAADNRLQRFLQQQPDEAPSFAATPVERGIPEARLAAWLAPEAHAFGLFGVADEVTQALRSARRFSEQVRRMLGQPALVRSNVGGRPLGRTRVSWTGDVRTAWRPGLAPPDAALHEQAVQLALATSRAWLRIVTLVAASAVQLSLLLPSGIGALTALPAAWDFVSSILDEYEHLRQLQAESARP